MTRYYRYLDHVMRARVFYRVLGKSVRYVFGRKPIIWPNVAGPTTYELITTATLILSQGLDQQPPPLGYIIVRIEALYVLQGRRTHRKE